MELLTLDDSKCADGCPHTQQQQLRAGVKSNTAYRLHDFRRLRRRDSPSSKSESLIRLATELKYPEDSTNDAVDAVAGATLDIKPARYPVWS